MELRYVTFNTNIGWVGILASAEGLLGTTLPQRSAQEARQLLGNNVNQAVCSPQPFTDLIERFKAYFNGHKVEFPDELDLSGATVFQCRVWEITRLIPYGETRSYGRIAEQIGRPGAARAVGQALGSNSLPVIIPCHRVIGHNGELKGYGGGLWRKQYLINLESKNHPNSFQ